MSCNTAPCVPKALHKHRLINPMAPRGARQIQQLHPAANVDVLSSTSCAQHKPLCCSPWQSRARLLPAVCMDCTLLHSSHLPLLLLDHISSSQGQVRGWLQTELAMKPRLAPGSSGCPISAIKGLVRTWLGFRNDFHGLRVTLNSETIEGVGPREGLGSDPQVYNSF